MVTKAFLFKTLEKCAGQAEKILKSIVKNSQKSKMKYLYKKLKNSKQTLYGNTLFRNTSSLIGELKRSETISEEEKGEIEQLVAQIDLALFAYNVYRFKEDKTCSQAFFQRAVSPFNKYTKNEIRLFLSLRLYLLRQAMNTKKNANILDLIKEQFSKEPSTYHFGDTESSEKEAGKRQIMTTVDIVSGFLCSNVDNLNDNIRFGSSLMVRKFLKAFVQYRLSENFSGEADREIEEGFPETEDELKALVDEIFNTEFIDKINEEAEAETNGNNDDEENSNGSDEEYTVESSNSDEESDSEHGGSGSDSDKSSTAPSSNKKDETKIPRVLPVNEDDEEDQLTEETEEEATTRSIHQTRASASRRRITDEQPGARTVTAEEAGFSDDAGVSSTRRSSNASTANTSGSQRRRRLPRSSAQSSKKRKAPGNRGRGSSASDSNADNSSVDGEETDEEEDEEEEEEAPPPPPKYHICDDGRARRIPPLPKIREKAQRWTPEDVQALEEGLRVIKRRGWKEIQTMFEDKLGSFKTTQIKDKAVNEVKRRQKLGLPLEGFRFVINPRDE